MTPTEIRALVLRLDTTSARDEQETWAQLRGLGVTVVPYLLEAYRTFRKSRGRVSLVKALLTHSDARTVEDARAAIDAISSRNHHYFMDRGHSGRSFWQVTEGDVRA
jgi:ABC-type thiamine transport system substrate-binding protein